MPKVDPREAEDPANAMLAALVDTLEAHGVEYAFTGSFTLAFWSQPRSSKDIDVVVLLEPDRSKRRALLHDLATAGFGVPTAALDDLERVHATALDLPLRHGAKLIVELIVPEPEREALSRRIVSRARSIPLPLRPRGVRVVTPEDLVVYKLLLFRDGSRALQTDDLKDIRDLVAMRKDDLDFGYIDLALDVENSLPRTEVEKRRRWFDKTRAEFGKGRRPRRGPRRSEDR
ncbi:MAG: nucleotidyl transferase AbiEii/AbiGii toxin family protein [Planctomycetes bacterium]|nr:nucleotidyl transferase AbiEii/AbiGii toxin family protein [Planctomycetota bacterium]